MELGCSGLRPQGRELTQALSQSSELSSCQILLVLAHCTLLAWSVATRQHGEKGVSVAPRRPALAMEQVCLPLALRAALAGSPSWVLRRKGRARRARVAAEDSLAKRLKPAVAAAAASTSPAEGSSANTSGLLLVGSPSLFSAIVSSPRDICLSHNRTYTHCCFLFFCCY
ncbi:hypothetical protein EDB85DRAFT_1534104 [Lactarius pseudohatsudake]|nr:hypothetical protein EDB85DRAFT_1534104 [Lactarius pseudohatsudake]